MSKLKKILSRGPAGRKYRDDDDTDVITGDGSTYGGGTVGDGGDIDTDSDKDRRGKRGR